MSTHTPERLRCEVCDVPTLGDTLCNRHYEEQEKMAHTPGPYHIGIKPGPILYGPQGEQLIPLNALLDAEEHLANLHLFKAAPAMLEALKRFAQAIKADNYDQDLLVDIYHDVREAIRLAEGRS